MSLHDHNFQSLLDSWSDPHNTPDRKEIALVAIALALERIDENLDQLIGNRHGEGMGVLQVKVQ